MNLVDFKQVPKCVCATLVSMRTGGSVKLNGKAEDLGH